MKNKNLLIVDAGTSSMRGILYQESGEKLCTYQLTYKPNYENNGYVSQSAQEWEHALYRIAKWLGEWSENQGKDIDGIVLTAQRSSIIPVDCQGNPLMAAIMWQDTRNFEICQELRQYNDILQEKTGSLVNTVFSGSKMTWIKQFAPEIYKKTYKFLNIPEYLIFLLTGEFHSDVTYGSRSGLMNIRERKWDKEILQLYQVKESELCELFEPGEIVGKVTHNFSQKTGIKEGIPVISAGGDQQCASVAQGAYKEGNLSIVAGTGGFLTMISEKLPRHLPKEIVYNCAAIKGKYMMEANILTCSSAFDWFCDKFYRNSNNQEIDYDLIDYELKVNDEISQILVLPYFNGRSTPDWNTEAKAVFANMTLASEKKDLLKGLLEGIFLEINNNMDSFRNFTDIKKGFISGGMTASSAINQLQADVYGIPLYHRVDCEMTAKGAFIVAACSLSLYSNIEKAFESTKEYENVYFPNMQKQHMYRKKQKEMNEFYKNMDRKGELYE